MSIDPEEIARRLEAVKALLEQMEGVQDPDEDDVAMAAEVALLMKSLADDVGGAVRNAVASERVTDLPALGQASDIETWIAPPEEPSRDWLSIGVEKYVDEERNFWRQR